MPITSQLQTKAGKVHRLQYLKQSSSTGTLAARYSSLFGSTGNVTGVLTAATTAGVIPVSGTAGYPAIPTPNIGWNMVRATTNIGALQAAGNTTTLIRVFDRLWFGGSYGFTSNTAITPPTLPAARTVGFENGRGLVILIENATAGIGGTTHTITFNNQLGNSVVDTAGNASNDAGAITQVNYPAGTKGVRGITNIQFGGGASGTFNVMIVKPICSFLLLNTNGMGNDSRLNLNVSDLGALPLPTDTALYVVAHTRGVRTSTSIEMVLMDA